MSGRLMPWLTWQEWTWVYECLYSNSIDSVFLGIDRVQAWKCRGRLPLAVDATSALVHAQARDSAGGLHPGEANAWHGGRTLKGLSVHDEAALQRELALTIIRLVNGVSDAGQKGAVASSVAKQATTAGMHPMLVEVRHEATHNQMPSIHLLRLAAAHALSWLQETYWVPQAAALGAAAADISSLLVRLWCNQRARWEVARRAAAPPEPSGPSSSCSYDSDDDAVSGSGGCGSGVAGASPVQRGKKGTAMTSDVLKRQQRALLAEFRVVAGPPHARHVADLMVARIPVATCSHAAAHDGAGPDAAPKGMHTRGVARGGSKRKRQEDDSSGRNTGIEHSEERDAARFPPAGPLDADVLSLLEDKVYTKLVAHALAASVAALCRCCERADSLRTPSNPTHPGVVQGDVSLASEARAALWWLQAATSVVTRASLYSPSNGTRMLLSSLKDLVEYAGQLTSMAQGAQGACLGAKEPELNETAIAGGSTNIRTRQTSAEGLCDSREPLPEACSSGQVSFGSTEARSMLLEAALLLESAIQVIARAQSERRHAALLLAAPAMAALRTAAAPGAPPAGHTASAFQPETDRAACTLSEHDALLSRLVRAARAKGRQEAVGSGGGAGSAWRAVTSWRPCPVGTLPGTCPGVGRIPSLVRNVQDTQHSTTADQTAPEMAEDGVRASSAGEGRGPAVALAEGRIAEMPVAGSLVQDGVKVADACRLLEREIEKELRLQLPPPPIRADRSNPACGRNDLDVQPLPEEDRGVKHDLQSSLAQGEPVVGDRPGRRVSKPASRLVWSPRSGWLRR